MSIALARRYRPRRFADLLVQDHVAAALRGAVARNRVGHGYLLTGPRGVGKTTAARILAMALNCDNRDLEHPTGEPCGECEACLRIWNGSANLDVIEIDAASNRGVDDARDLRERAQYAASQAGHHKVYIIDEAHMLTREAWNTLLKILEEPPPGVVFVFATTEPQKIANTAAPVMSRLQRFDFRRIGPAAILSRLKEVLRLEGIEAEEDALLLIARHADGGMRDALSVLDQCLSFGEGPLTAARVRDMLGLLNDEVYAAILTLIADRRPGDVFAIIDQVVDAGGDLAEFAGGLAELLRAVILQHYGASGDTLPQALRTVIAATAGRILPEDAVRMLKLLAEAEPGIRRSANPRLAVETLLLRWAMMDRVVDLKALLSGVLPAWTVEEKGERSKEQGERSKEQGERKGKGDTRNDSPVYSPVSSSSADPSPPIPSPGVSTAGVPVPRTNEALAAVWKEICAVAAAQSFLLGQALEHAMPSFTATGDVVLAYRAESAVFQAGAERQLSAVTAMIAARLGGSVLVKVIAGTGLSGEAVESAKRGGRLTESDLKADRLRQLRAADPALDAAVDALDLELVDEG